MIIAGLILAALAAFVHVYIFVLESVRWMHPSTRKTFGIPSEQDAATMKGLAFNQGFYNLFLAIVVLIGILFSVVGSSTVGITLVIAGAGMMFAAAVVLVSSDSSKLRAALMQGTLPLLAVICTAIGATLS